MTSQLTASISRRSSVASSCSSSSVEPELLPIDPDGSTTLHHAAKTNDISLLESILSTPIGLASIDIRDSNGRTPFALACIHGHYELAEILFQHGCDYWKYDNGHREPLDHIRENSHTELLQLWAIYVLGPEDKEWWTPIELATCFHEHGAAAILQDWKNGIRRRHGPKVDPNDEPWMASGDEDEVGFSGMFGDE